MVKALISELKSKHDIKFLVAPYEADAQLAHLFHQGKVDFVISEDSDLLLFGIQQVLFKLDLQGNGVEINLKNMYKNKTFKEVFTI